jgi:hypothetical protein
MLEVCSMIAEADSHQCVSSEVKDCVAPSRALRNGFEVPEVPPNHLQTRVALLMAQVGAMTRMKIIEDYYLPFILEQSVDKVTPDESQPTCDECPLHTLM